ncbi:S-layer homology domain-containing protein [Heliorestis convoluta]|uniref:SLH domain-containing protein n=1 Tax=Heliorestis convoluta TaxID=356322 RepID=A0A5Q2MXL5_9FIRM|nr:S-layer homology domain-containing protein [Heliorestis convoluta]QGG47287.1 hypothetical protein FTV88_1140 [Heliorestis convoluta]
MKHPKKITQIITPIVLSAFLLTAASSPVASASSFTDVYSDIKKEHPQFVSKLVEGGASEQQIKSFLQDLEKEVNKSTTLTDSNFNTELFKAVGNVFATPTHSTVFKALNTKFGEEIESTLATSSLHPNLQPLHHAVKQSIVPESAAPPTGGSTGGGGGGGGGSVTTPTNNETPDNETNTSDDETPAPQAPTEQPPTPFHDLTTHWAEANIRQLIQENIITGYPDNTFRPDNNITRAEFAILTLKAFQIPLEGNKTFTDTAGHWAKDYIAAAYNQGIISGYSSDTFGPDNPITREQMALMIIRAANLTAEHNTTTNFKDQSAIAPWAEEAVATAVQAKLISGFPDGTFRPQERATRAQAATILINLRNNK